MDNSSSQQLEYAKQNIPEFSSPENRPKVHPFGIFQNSPTWGKYPSHQQFFMGPNPNGPYRRSCDRAMRYSGFFGVRGPRGTVGDFLELLDSVGCVYSNDSHKTGRFCRPLLVCSEKSYEKIWKKEGDLKDLGMVVYFSLNWRSFGRFKPVFFLELSPLVG